MHGWRRIDGEIHLRLTLTDGSIGCLPAAWTDLFEATAQEQQPPHRVNLHSIRAVRLLVEALSARHATGERRLTARPPA